MSTHVQTIIVGQGLAGSALAWTLSTAGHSLMIVDRGEPNSASRVAAGLVTPVTGKRLVQSPDFEADWAPATAFYQKVEQRTGQHFWTEAPMLRLFANEHVRAEFLQRSDNQQVQSIACWDGLLQAEGQPQLGIVMQPAGRLNVPAYLAATRTHFESLNSLRCEELNFARDVEFTDRQVTVKRLDLIAKRIVLCQGATANDYFPNVPNNPARGDILKVRIPDYIRPEVAHRSVWIAPNSDGTQSVGATYDWNSTVAEPSSAGRDEVLHKLGRMVDGDVEVVDHTAGVRPTMKDYEAVLGRHPNIQQLFVFNGLGSKGTLKAPRLAAELSSILDGEDNIRATVCYDRLKTTSEVERRPRPLTQRAQEAVASVLQPGDSAVDATVGNGFDTCFLSRTVGPTGFVIGFDVQQSALNATAKRLQAADLHNVTLLHKGHETLADEATSAQPPTAIMFNLGFLPRSDHAITTQPRTTVKAITAAVELLKPAGVLTVLAYRGHAGGPEEFAAVEQLLQRYADTHDLQTINSTPAKATSPVLFVLKKATTKT
ncbi:FAD-dependent oxidoreductase [Fuerstiella marisgermanici]|uniref:Glycine oxidase n=1 Tax=Fuerstiella marisgermanici TaxID=1891926 RepID=A0A1P8WME9_9PLAN|nr:FAD-dependent oxidoreductase [Fuerstiella marisgermanici]APZ95224.1 Glycine oxidase [Fuerstiella marisgermanici]